MTRNAAECPFSTQCSVFHINSFRFFFFPSSKESKSQRKRIEPERKKKRKKAKQKRWWGSRWGRCSLDLHIHQPPKKTKKQKRNTKILLARRASGSGRVLYIMWQTSSDQAGGKEGGGGRKKATTAPHWLLTDQSEATTTCYCFFFSFPSGSSSRRLELVGSVGFSFLFFFSVHVGVVFIGRQLAVTSASCFYVFFFKKKLSRVCFFGKDSTGRWRVFLGFPATAFATVQKNEKKRTSTHKKTDQMI